MSICRKISVKNFRTESGLLGERVQFTERREIDAWSGKFWEILKIGQQPSVTRFVNP